MHLDFGSARVGRMARSVSNADEAMMARCVDLAKSAKTLGEYPYAAVICRGGEVVVETVNRVARDGDVTRHAEIVAVSEAQKALGRMSLDDCTLYASAEPCPLCSYAIRESRIGRVVFGLRSPHMGGFTRWPILQDEGLSTKMPEVFAPPPEIVAGFRADEAAQACEAWNPVFWAFIKHRGILTDGGTDGSSGSMVTLWRQLSLRQRAMAALRKLVFDPMSGRARARR
jgi:tRNA(adenine34) deaminase